MIYRSIPNTQVRNYELLGWKDCGRAPGWRECRVIIWQGRLPAPVPEIAKREDVFTMNQ